MDIEKLKSKYISYGKQYIDNDDINSVVEVLKSDFLTCGPKVEEFEKELCNFTGYKYTTVCNSGTSALFTALKVARIGPGDEVIVPGLTFIATASVVEQLGAKIVFCDVDPDSFLIDIEDFERKITTKTKAVICVDYAGQLCDYEKIIGIAKRKGVIVISDACHSFGAIRREKTNFYPDITCYSFHPVKHITTGEGGAILTNNKLFSIDIKMFINQGRLYENRINAPYTEYYFPGMNFRMSDISAALGISQLKKYDSFQEIRNKIVNIYNDEFKNLNIQIPKIINIHTWHLYVIKINDRNKFISDMYFSKIKCQIHYPPVYKTLAFFKYKMEAEKSCKNIESIYEKIVTIPLHCSMLSYDMKRVIEAVKKFS